MQVFGRVASLRLVAVLMLVGAAVQGRAGLVRSVSGMQPGRVVVELSWTFESAPESAMVVAEQVPSGWMAQLDVDSVALVDRVRTEPGSISFLIGLKALSAPGRIAYVLTQASSEGGSSSLSGTCLKSEGVHVVSSVIAGASEFTAPAEGSDPAPTAALKIVDFSVSGGDDPRITLTWQGGIPRKPVVVEWMPLASSSSVPLRKGVTTAQAVVEGEAGWQEFWAVPVADMQIRDLCAPGDPGTNSVAPIYVVSPDKFAPSGFYRLRTSD